MPSWRGGRQQGPLRPLDRRRGERHARPGSPSPSCRTRSNQVANWLRQQGLKRGDHLLLVLNNVAPLWEIMLAAMKLGVVVIPATTLLTTEELADRVERGRARMIVTDEDQVAKCAGLAARRRRVRDHQRQAASPAGCRSATPTSARPTFTPDGATNADDPLLLYFTSGTTAKPKLVRHSHRSYPVGALSTMYWLGLQPGDVHVNISSPGWAKHAWSTFFAPWNAGATVLMVNQAPFNAKALLGVLERCKVTTFCAPPTVWRLMIQEDLAASEGRAARGLRRGRAARTPRSSTRCRRPGASPSATATARPRPRRRSPTRRARRSSRAPWAGRCRAIASLVLDADGMPTDEGEICLDLNGERPAGLMQGYADAAGNALGRQRQGLSHRRRRQPRRGRLPDLRRPRRRRLQVVGLSHQPVRAGERADRARGRRRSGRSCRRPTRSG